MGRKSSAKDQRAADHGISAGKSGKSVGPMLLGVVIVALLGIGVLAMWSGAPSGASPTTEAGAAGDPQNAAKNPPPVSEVAKNEAAAQARAALGPHKQANLPALPIRGYAPPRPMQTVMAAFQFAAEHPEVLSYIPCYCGCQNQGHRGNDECFVKARNANGDVTEWQEHGLECAVCIDIATRSRQMFSSGAALADIRASIEKEYGPNFPSMTATPQPPHSH